ncbi:MAG TPA: SurA N-terminal domain-containing protein [Xanthobacteraceae bacterium]|nr:SurA N-terminal domain-containing protein [Xanthobacteraceae bacterium]
MRLASPFTLTLLLAALLAAGAPASAQNVIAMVNGEPITGHDLASRTKLFQGGNQKPPPREQVIEELINEKIKIQHGKRNDVKITDTDVERAFATMAQRSNRSAAVFTAALQQSGIDPNTLKQRLRAELMWRQVLQATAPGVFQVRDADVVAILTARGEQPQTTAMQYSLRQIVFVVAKGTPDAAKADRQKEAEALRARFLSCEEGVQIAREYREVVIKDPVRRLSTDLALSLQKLLAETPDGRLTPPEPTNAGFEVVAVCERKQVIADVSGRREFKEQILAQRLQAYEKTLLEDLKRKAIIKLYP